MKKEAKILMADMSTMDPLAKSGYMMYRDYIGKEVMASQAVAAAAAAATVPAMEQPMSVMQLQPATVIEKAPMTPVMEQPSVMEEPKIMEVSPPIIH
jgi:hypothetical protein